MSKSEVKEFLFQNLTLILVFVALSLLCQITTIATPGWMKFHLEFYDDVKVSSASNGSTLSDLTAEVSAGLWFFSFCFDGRYQNGTELACFTETFIDYDNKHLSKFHVDHLELLKDFCFNALSGLLEYQIEASISIACLLIGLVAYLLYYKSRVTKKGSGIVACSCFAISAIMLWLVVGKITTITLQMKKTFEFPMAASHATITVLMPWCLLVAGLSALMTSYSTMTFLVYLAQDKTPQHRYMKTNSHQQILVEDQEPCCSNNNHHSIPMTRLK